MQIPFFRSLRFKIGVGYIILVAINVAATSWAIYNFGRLTTALNTILGEKYPNVMLVENMARSIDEHESAIVAVLNGDVASGKTSFDEAKNEFYQLFQRANEDRSVPDAGSILDNITITYQGYLLVTDSLFALTDVKDFKEAKAFYYSTVVPFSRHLTDNCFLLIDANQKEMQVVARATKQTSDEAIIAVLLAAFFATGLSIVTMIQFTKRIIMPAERLTETVHKIGRGRLDLKLEIQTNDEIGELGREFNKMTERLRKFEELNIEKILSEKNKSETIVESISDAIIVCDSGLNVQLMNRSAEELLDVREQDIIGKPIRECVTDERLLEIFSNPADSVFTDQPYLLFRHRGRQVYLRPRLSVIPSTHGRQGVVLVLQDVTQFKELDKMKSDFMAAVSHEFRTPLTSINMGVDILRQGLLGPLTGQQEELLEGSKHDCERLTKLVRELLQLSKLESGKIAMREEIVDIQKVIESAIQPLRLPFREKGVELRILPGGTLPPLVGDEQQFSWVISNLINNALRYTDSGGVVEVATCRDGENVLIRVKDTGRGIAPEHLSKIFDKFVQIKQSRDNTPGSVGLGLAIAKEIVEMYGGKIWAESTPNAGSTFSFRLPAGQGQAV